ncbi:hypothetical protein ACHWQZ_G005676 [Mnemiopsis leidyi]
MLIRLRNLVSCYLNVTCRFSSVRPIDVQYKVELEEMICTDSNDDIKRRALQQRLTLSKEHLMDTLLLNKVELGLEQHEEPISVISYFSDLITDRSSPLRNNR